MKVIINKTNYQIESIIYRKMDGIDCTEQESAEIKQEVKNNPNYNKKLDVLFPIEIGEAMQEKLQNTNLLNK